MNYDIFIIGIIHKLYLNYTNNIDFTTLCLQEENIVYFFKNKKFASGTFYGEFRRIINIRRILVLNILLINYSSTLNHELRGEQNSSLYRYIFIGQLRVGYQLSNCFPFCLLQVTC